MKAAIKVLVTGAGSLLGEGIIRALRASSLKLRIVAVDPSPLAAGLYWADTAHLIAIANAADYLARIEEILILENPQVVFVGTDVELSIFAAHRERLEREYSTTIIVSSPEVIAIADDKWKTYQFLVTNGFDHPESCLPGGEKELVNKVGFPLIVKPRIGARSIGVNLVHDWNGLRAAIDTGGNVIIQECVGTPESEYTAGALYFDGRCDASIVMRRQLRDGNTYRAFIEEFPQLNCLVRRWTEALKPFGPANFQFRLAEGRAKVFEINGRFSGTTPLRAHAGFNEVEMTLRHLLRGDEILQPAVRPMAILRHWTETVVEPHALLGSEAIPPAAAEIPLPAVARQRGEFRVMGTAQHQEWMAVLRRSVQHDFYHLPQYHRLAEQRGEGEARLFTYQEGPHTIALPLILRPIGDLAADGWNDATSVYGYGGPLASTTHFPESVAANFRDALRQELVRQRIVTVFSRLHPLIPQSGLLAGLGDCRASGQTVSIDLTLSPEAQRAQYSASYRTRLNKLARNGITSALDPAQRHLDEFMEMYHETMRRVKANASYCFDADYFNGLSEQLGSVLHLFVTRYGGEVIAGGLFTLCDGIVQYHLGATRDAFLKLSPMRQITDTVRLWANERGARVVHLGGGVGAREDSVFNYKAGFSSQRHDFMTWRWIVVPELYRALCERRTRVNQQRALEPSSADYFPSYRCPAAPRDVEVSGRTSNAVLETFPNRGE